MTGGKDFISDKPIGVVNQENYFGITILSQNYEEYTGFSKNWGLLINYWKNQKLYTVKKE